MNTAMSSHQSIIDLLKTEQYDRVIEICKTKKNPDADILQFQGMAFCQKGNLDAAKEIFLKAIQIKPKDPTLLYNYAEVLIDQKDRDGALTVLKKICNEHPEFKAAQSKLNDLTIQAEEKNLEDHLLQDLSRSKNPLAAAFTQDEIEKTLQNTAERQKKSRQLKLQDRPSFFALDKEVIADELLLAAEDALRAGQAELTLKLCTDAAELSTNCSHIYGLAGDAYMALKKINYAHLCYLVSMQYGELDISRQVNLVSIAQALGDYELFEKRRDSILSSLEGQSQ